MITAEELVGEEWAEWYRLTPAERWTETEKLWQVYLALGGSLDPEPDTQSPFFDASDSRQASGEQEMIEQAVRFQWRADLEKLRHAK